ncbi:hypothetical protein IAE19_00490 [Acinetobacter sp. S40]|uniref:hypothetical protein n=1 Tax=Acinetobacter sp. S40 TaxID=2767434 RepID=UPI00190B884C|nr:hypothetical protein [Acinetobacter sp. S40]MBJ9983922.1 hypothetical protein [Acinetobacter sp. S40]
MDIRFIPVLDLDNRQPSYHSYGFADPFISLIPDYYLYAIHDISDANLSKILKDTIFKNTSLNGGYVLLNAEQQPILLPRCCSDLNDIHAWDHLAQGNLKQFWIGHPQVLCEYEGDMVKFKPDASHDHTGFEVPVSSLKQAVQSLKDELKHIHGRFQHLASMEKLKMEKVLKLIPQLH